jgi:oligoribonuclease NrnB/cAMP/cGMP phosphodiesterase (DHH superfamily)
MTNLYDYVIYHRGCFDGFTGFFILNKTNRIQKNAIIYPDIPSAKEVPPNIDDKNIIIIDVAYKKEILQSILDKAKKVTFIDHHVSIRDDVNNLNINKEHEIIYDEKMSGATLVWQYFYNNKKMPLFLKYIQDNDIGAWKLKYTKPFILGLKVNYITEPTRENMNKWNKLFNKKEVLKLIKKGFIYGEYHKYLIDINVKKYSMLRFPSKKLITDFPEKFKKEGEYKVAVYNGGGCPDASSLGVEFMNKVGCDFVIMWNYQFDKKEFVLIFRSGGDKEENVVDVGDIAKLFGGGGHKQASACSFSKNKYDIHDLFTSEILPRSNK